MMRFLLLLAIVIISGSAFAQSEEIPEGIVVGTRSAFRGIGQSQLGTPPSDSIQYDVAPVVKVRKNPRFPLKLLQNKQDGEVYLKAWVDSKGIVKKAIILKSSDEAFDRPCLIAAMQWTFTPAIQRGRPIDSWVNIPFHFKVTVGPRR